MILPRTKFQPVSSKFESHQRARRLVNRETVIVGPNRGYCSCDPSWAMCSCQTCGVHSRDGGKDAGLATRGLEFITPFLTFYAGGGIMISILVFNQHQPRRRCRGDTPWRSSRLQPYLQGAAERTQWRCQGAGGPGAHASTVDSKSFRCSRATPWAWHPGKPWYILRSSCSQRN